MNSKTLEPQKLSTAIPTSGSSAAKNIDGFFRTRRSTTVRLVKPNATTVIAPAAPQPMPRKQPGRDVNHATLHTPQTATTATPPKVARHHTPVTANHLKHHATQDATTLMRKSVKRPSPSFHKLAHTKGALRHTVPSLIVPKQSALSVDEARLMRAQHATHSPQVRHNGDVPKAIEITLVPLAVQPVPDKPEAQTPTTPPAPKQDNKPADIFEHALANANHFVDIQADKLHFKKTVRRHVLSMAAGTLALVIIAGFAAYQNTPGLQFKIASVQAGVATDLPNFKAAGFAYQGVKATDGKLIVGFSNASGSFHMTQQSTNMSSSDVIHTIGATDASGRPVYKTVQAKATTIYRFSNTEATWVQNGTWYSLSGTGSLTDQQVAKLAQNI